MNEATTQESNVHPPVGEAQSGGPTPLVKGVSITSIITGLALAGLFFLPWVEFGCEFSGQRFNLMQASGLQLVTGDIAEGNGVEDLKTAMKGMGGGEVSTGPDTSKEDIAKVSEHVPSRLWFILGLLCPLLIAFAGVKGLGGGSGKSVGLLLIVGAGLGLVTCLTSFTVDYIDAMEKSETKTEVGSADVERSSSAIAHPVGLVLIPNAEYAQANDDAKFDKSAKEFEREFEKIGKEMEKGLDDMGKKMETEIGGSMNQMGDEMFKQSFSTKPSLFLWLTIVLYLAIETLGILCVAVK